MSEWQDIDMPPLDIMVAARAIAEVWRESMRKVEFDGGGMHVPHEALRLGDRVIEILKTYDQCRTLHIKFLRDELIRLRNVTIEPLFIKREP